MVSTHILSIGKKQDEENHVRMVCYYLSEYEEDYEYMYLLILKQWKNKS